MIHQTITLREGRKASPRALKAATTILPRDVYYLVAYYLPSDDGVQLCYRWHVCAAGLTMVIDRLHDGTLPKVLHERVDCGMPCEEVFWDRNDGKTECHPVNGGVPEFASKGKYAFGL
jgi:hypothetical protein